MSESKLIPSILTSIKKNCNIPAEITVFDPDLLLHINSAFAKLNQMGIGPKEPFMIEDDSATWDEFCDDRIVNMVRTWMYLEVLLVFDPPTASVLSALERRRDELEWRLNVAKDELLYAKSEENQNERDD